MVWPDGQEIPLITIEKDHFIDRAYWQSVVLKRDANGSPQELKYGDFIGKAIGSNTNP